MNSQSLFKYLPEKVKNNQWSESYPGIQDQQTTLDADLKIDARMPYTARLATKASAPSNSANKSQSFDSGHAWQNLLPDLFPAGDPFAFQASATQSPEHGSGPHSSMQSQLHSASDISVSRADNAALQRPGLNADHYVEINGDQNPSLYDNSPRVDTQQRGWIPNLFTANSTAAAGVNSMSTGTSTAGLENSTDQNISVKNQEGQIGSGRMDDIQASSANLNELSFMRVGFELGTEFNDDLLPFISTPFLDMDHWDYS